MVIASDLDELVRLSSVDEVNTQLSNELDALKREPPAPGNPTAYLETITGNLNAMLYSAIMHHGTTLNAVQIDVEVDVSEESKDFSWRKNYRLKAYIGKARQLKNRHVRYPRGRARFMFTLHLPYSVSRATDDPDVEQDGRSDHIGFGISLSTPYLRLLLGDEDGYSGDSVSKPVYFAPHEVKSIRLAYVKDTQFSPLYQGYDAPLKVPLSSVEHYLIFMGFHPRGINEQKLPVEVDKAVLQLAREILAGDMPAHALNLRPILNTGPKSFKDTLLSMIPLLPDKKDYGLYGLAASGDGNTLTLYQFKGTPIPEEVAQIPGDIGRRIQAAYAIMQHSTWPQPTVTTYTGLEIIRKLARDKESMKTAKVPSIDLIM